MGDSSSKRQDSSDETHEISEPRWPESSQISSRNVSDYEEYLKEKLREKEIRDQKLAELKSLEEQHFKRLIAIRKEVFETKLICRTQNEKIEEKTVQEKGQDLLVELQQWIKEGNTAPQMIKLVSDCDTILADIQNNRISSVLELLKQSKIDDGKKMDRKDELEKKLFCFKKAVRKFKEDVILQSKKQFEIEKRENQKSLRVKSAFVAHYLDLELHLNELEPLCLSKWSDQENFRDPESVQYFKDKCVVLQNKIEQGLSEIQQIAKNPLEKESMDEKLTNLAFLVLSLYHTSKRVRDKTEDIEKIGELFEWTLLQFYINQDNKLTEPECLENLKNGVDHFLKP